MEANVDIKKFVAELADVLDVQPAQLEDAAFFQDFEWDSLQILATISLVDEHFNVAMSGNDLSGHKSLTLFIENIEVRKQRR